MGNSQNDYQDSYYDDPIEEISHSKLRSKFLTTGVLILGSIFFFQSTLASNFSLNSGSGIEFGQGISQAAACSGEHSLILTPHSTFTNGSGSSGAHYLNSVTISDIPDSCYGVDFTINAYSNKDSSPLALFNFTSTSAVVYDNGGNFSRGIGSTGMTVESSTGTFTTTFTTPVAQTSNVFKFTVQSGSHTPVFDLGSTGLGGGLIYYADPRGFNCGATYSPMGSPTGGPCHYLEVAPYLWNTVSDPLKQWATGTASTGNATLDVPEIANNVTSWLSAAGIGLGYLYSIAIVAQGNDTTTAAGAARAYSGGSKSDWYLPNSTEMNLFCEWSRGIATSVTTQCAGGTINSATYGGDLARIELTNYYWTSSEISSIRAYGWWNTGLRVNSEKFAAYLVRPVRAF